MEEAGASIDLVAFHVDAFLAGVIHMLMIQNGLEGIVKLVMLSSIVPEEGFADLQRLVA